MFVSSTSLAKQLECIWRQVNKFNVIFIAIIATGYGLDCQGIESRWRQDFSHLSRPAVEPNQPPVQWVPGLSRGVKSGRGVKLTPHLLVPWSWKSRAVPLLPLWAARPVRSLSACIRVHFTFTFTLYLHSFLSTALGEVEWYAFKPRPLYHCKKSSRNT